MRKIIHRYTVLLLTVLLVGTGIALADTDVIVLGDVNSDGSVNTTDVTVLVNYLHGSGTVNMTAADANQDGAVDIADVTAIKNIISNGTFDKGTASTLFFPTATVNNSYGDAAFKNQLVRSGSTGAITYTSSATGVATVNTTTGEVTIQGAGTATITATLADNGGISGTFASYTVNVAQATNSLTTTPVLASTSQDFTGSPVTLVTTEGAALFGSVEYSTTSATEGFSTTVPTATNAGDYTVWYRVLGTASYTTIDAVKLGTVTISPATLSVTASDYSGSYDGTAHGITVTCDGATIKYGETEGTYDLDASPTLTNVGTKTVYYQVTKDNYTTVTGSQTVTITQATNSFTTQPTIEGWTYGADANTPTGAVVQFGTPTYKYCATEDGEYGTYDAVVNGQAGTWYVKGFVEGTTNYAAATSGAVSFTISKADITPSVTMSGWTYGEDASTPSVSGNTGNGGVTYQYKESGADDGTYSESKPTTPGTYTVKATIAETTNYNGSSATVDFTIASGTLAVTASNYSGAYDGVAHGITVTCEDATVKYGETEGTYDLDVSPTLTNVGTKTVYYQVTKDNYTTVTGSQTVTIIQAANSFTTQPTIEGWTYGADANTPTGAVVQFGTPTYKYCATEDGEYGTYDAVVNGQAGTWYVKGFVEATTDYAAATSDAVSFTIANATMTGITATAYNAAYDGEAHGITVTGVPDGATVTYGTTEGTYDQSENPTYTDVAAARTVYFKVSKANYSDFTGSSTVTITQATNSFTTQPTITGWTYGADANAPTGAVVQFGNDAITYKYSSAENGEYGTYDAVVNGQAGTWYVKGFVEATTNYAAATSNAVSFTVNKVAATVTTAPAAVSGDLTYTGEALTLFNAGSVTGGTLMYKVTTSSTKPENTDGFKTTIDQQTNAGTYYLWYYVEGDANHNSTDINATGISKTINKAALSSLSVSMSGWTYGGTATSPSVSNNSGNGTVTYNYKVSTAADNTYSTTKPTNADTYTVRASVAETANYNAGTATANFTIAKANGAATLSSSSVAFGTSTANKTVTVSGNTGTVSASVTSGSGCTVGVSGSTVTITRSSNAAFNATITVTIAASTNYNSTTKTISVSGTAVLRNMTSATSDDIGKVICSNGHIHSNVSDVTCGGSASAMIAYVGNQNNANGNGAYNNTYNHGLAIALADVINTSGDPQTTASHSNYMMWENAKTACSSFKSSKPSGVTWMLPSAYQWERMLIGCGSTATYVAYSSQSFPTSSNGFPYGNFRTKLTGCGENTQGVYDVQSLDYWSSTEYSGYTSLTWSYRFGSSCFNFGNKMSYTCVRACYAF